MKYDHERFNTSNEYLLAHNTRTVRRESDAHHAGFSQPSIHVTNGTIH